MTHKLIHDEEKLEHLRKFVEMYPTVYGDYVFTLPVGWSKYLAMDVVKVAKQYAEHAIIKLIDSEIERLSLIRSFEQAYGDAIEDQIEHFQSLKAELTKSK